MKKDGGLEDFYASRLINKLSRWDRVSTARINSPIIQIVSVTR